MAQETYRIEIDVELKDNTSPGVDRAQKALNKLEKDATRTERQLARLGRSRWNVVIGAVDQASSTIRRVERSLWGLTRRTWNISIAVATSPFRMLGKLRDTLLSERAFYGGLMAAGAAYAGAVQPMKLANEFTRANIAMRTFLGNQEKAQAFMKELTQFAIETPFEQDFLTEQAVKLLPAFKGNTRMILRTLKAFGDAAAMTGATEADIELALLGFRQMASVGTLSLEELKQVTENLRVPMDAILEELGVAKSDLKDIGKKGIPAARAMEAILRALERPIPKGGFLGGMAAIMDTLGGQWTMFKDIIKNRLILRWGQGLESVMLPALKQVNEWIEKNDKAIEEFGNALYEAGQAFARFFVNGARKAKDALSQLVNSQDWKKAKGFEKLQIAWDKLIAEPFERWWNTGGRAWIERKAREIGGTFGQAFGAMLMGVFGITSADISDQSPFVQAGAAAGRAFVEGFFQEFDTSKIAAKMLEVFKNIQPSWLGGNTESLFGQLFALALDIIVLSIIMRFIRGIFRRGKSIVDFVRDPFGKRGKGGGGPDLPGGDGGAADAMMVAMERQAQMAQQQQQKASRWQRIKGWFSKAKSFVGRIPFLDTAFAVFDVLTAPTAVDRAGAVGGAAGGLLGGWLGSFLGPLGMIGGSVIGGMLGDWIGRSLAKVDWGKFKGTIATKLGEVMTFSKGTLSKGKSGLIGALSDLPFRIGSYFGSVLSLSRLTLGQLPNVLFDIGKKAVSGIASALSGLPGVVTNILLQAKDKAVQIASSIPSAVSNAFRTAKKAGSWLVNQVTTGFKSGIKFPMHAQGGIFDRPHLGIVAEAGPEAIIPLSPGMRSRGLALWAQAGHILGAFGGGSVSGVPVSVPYGGGVTITLNVSPQYSMSVNASNPADVAQALRLNHQKLAEELAEMVAASLEEVWSNMPTPAG